MSDINKFCRIMFAGVMLVILMVGIGGVGWAQPQYSVNFMTTVSPSSIPFNSTTHNKVQYITVCDNTRISDLDMRPHHSVRPNPSADQIGLHLNCFIPEIVNIEIMGLNGKVWHRQLTEFIVGYQTLHPDLISLPDGLYLIRLEGEHLSIAKEIVIRK